MWIWQHNNWPSFSWDEQKLVPFLRSVRQQEGILQGKAIATNADDPQSQQTLDTLLQNIISSSAIEGEQLNAESVRSSLAKRLKIKSEIKHPVTDKSEGLAVIMMDVMQHAQHEVRLNRLLVWHAHLFPNSKADSHSFSRPQNIGQLRGDEPMQVISGRIDKPRVHFEAPPRDVLKLELDKFLAWFKMSQNESSLDPILRAALTHLWFITLHPFGAR